MLTIEKASEALGMSTRQLRRRLSDTSPVLASHTRRGDKNRLLLDGSAIEILRTIEDYRANGYTVKQAMNAVRDSMQQSQPGEQEKTSRQTGDSAALRELIEEKDKRIQALEGEVAFLRDQVQTLTPLALPAPRRWLRFLIPSYRKA